MKMAAIVLFLFAAIIGGATFIENDYGPQTARALIYNTNWFELFLLYFILMLIFNMWKYKTHKNKLSVFIFHTAFLVIAIGAAVTRYVGYEGTMHIREGASSSHIVTNIKVLDFDLKSNGEKVSEEEQMILSSMTTNNFSKIIEIDGKEVHFELSNYLPASKKTLEANPNGRKALELMISNGSKGKPVQILEGDSYDAGTFKVTFNKPSNVVTMRPMFNIRTKADGTFEVEHKFPIKTLSMLTRKEQNLSVGVDIFEKKKLFQFNGNAVVLKKIHEKSVIKYVSSALKNKPGKPEMITLDVSVGEEHKNINLFAYSNTPGDIGTVTIAGIEIDLSFGAKLMNLPFSIKVIDFELERYPGSMSPASYASDVELTDKEEGIESMPYRIYMNHVLDHRNYRFFQSSYDRDELGTVLSVNHDPGALPTYLGYILLALGMIWNLFDKNGRFQKLLRGARKLQGAAVAVALMLSMGFVTPIKAASLPTLDDKVVEKLHVYNDENVTSFGKLIVQDSKGRMKPLDTLAHEIVAKISGSSSVYGLNPTSMLLGMTTEPRFYQKIPFIKISHTRIAKNLGLEKGSKYATFTDFFLDDGSYKLTKEIAESVRKKPLDKNTYDNELVKVDERLNVAYMVYTGALLNIYPVPNDASNKWVNPQKAIESFPPEIGAMIRVMTLRFFEGAGEVQKGGNPKLLGEGLHLMKLYQSKFGKAVLPSEDAVNIEITYNKLGLLSKLVPLYLLVGLVLLIAAFINVAKPNRWLKPIATISWILIILGFMVHVGSMGMRWYIGGHAPWSNAYESIVFIAGSTVLAGLIFARKSPFTLGATAFLAGVTMFVAHLNFINPEITNLVPVLKSYWLMIHVATIISGDGFLGLGSMVSMLVIFLFILRKESNSKRIDNSIKELTNIAEMSLIVGLFLMTIGNFLGGVWANESWGRYWGWDSKETWAAVTILVYATILHLRFIPKMNNPFVFNVAALWGYSSVIMTYFGVNYYLSGLHSYAAGEQIPLPSWVLPSVGVLFVLTMLAAKSWKNVKLALIILAPLAVWVGIIYAMTH